MTRTKMILGGVAAVLALAAAFGISTYYFGADEPDAVNLDAAIAAASTAAAQQTAAAKTSATASATTASGTSGASASGASSLAGNWSVVADGTSSFVGYRVKEELVGVGATTAVGRTGAVSGTLAFNGTQITAVEVQADVSKLASDRSMRDNALRQQALESSKFPTATFKLVGPIAISGNPSDGSTISATASGDFTIHGVTQRVSLPLQGKLVDGRVVVVGSTEILFADYNIEKPRAGSVLSVEDRATLEMQLVFAKA